MDVNGKQRLILKIIVGVIIAMILFQPTYFQGNYGGYATYRFILAKGHYYVLDTNTLIAQLLIYSAS
ncbi:MAG: hypothetical protein WA124_12650 [Smithella sp.]